MESHIGGRGRPGVYCLNVVVIGIYLTRPGAVLAFNATLTPGLGSLSLLRTEEVLGRGVYCTCYT